LLAASLQSPFDESLLCGPVVEWEVVTRTILREDQNIYGISSSFIIKLHFSA